ncbi:MAG: hypothetical protein K6F40_07850, partial [Bacteroidales bacterium]|nr:hypothetical protein [Bacteroidales bacterium]
MKIAAKIIKLSSPRYYSVLFISNAYENQSLQIQNRKQILRGNSLFSHSGAFGRLHPRTRGTDTAEPDNPG